MDERIQESEFRSQGKCNWLSFHFNSERSCSVAELWIVAVVKYKVYAWEVHNILPSSQSGLGGANGRLRFGIINSPRDWRRRKAVVDRPAASRNDAAGFRLIHDSVRPVVG